MIITTSPSAACYPLGSRHLAGGGSPQGAADDFLDRTRVFHAGTDTLIQHARIGKRQRSLLPTGTVAEQ